MASPRSWGGRVAIAAAGLATLLAALPGTSMAAPFPAVPADCVHERVGPARIVLACGDGNLVLTHLRWTSWTRSHATATGSALANLCDPSCAGGRFARYPVAVELRTPRRCAGGRLQFRRVLLTYGDRRPPGARRHEAVPLTCPLR